MNIQKATQDYELWIGKYLKLISADLKLKHEAMASGVFPFFRATFYRWMQRWPEVCPELNKAPKVLAVGDLHDPASLEKALEGCEALFHVAADYRLGASDPRQLYRTNVEGTRNLLDRDSHPGQTSFLLRRLKSCLKLQMKYRN